MCFEDRLTHLLHSAYEINLSDMISYKALFEFSLQFFATATLLRDLRTHFQAQKLHHSL